MARIILFALALITLNCPAQVKKGLTVDSDTSLYEFNNRRQEFFGLTPIEDIEASTAFRIWSPNSLLEIVKNGNRISGKWVFFIFEISQDNESNERFVKEYQLTEGMALALYDHYKTSEIEKLPTSAQIDDWIHGYDGITYILESKTRKGHSLKGFWFPEFQKDFTEVIKFKAFKKRLDQISDSDLYYKKFTVDNPFISFSYYGVSYSVVKVMSRKEKRKYLKAKKKKNQNKLH